MEGSEMIVIKRKLDGLFLGKFSKAIHDYPVREDISRAKKYTTVNRAKSAIVRITGYSDTTKYEFVEVER
jgi:hypothetical protein